MSEEKQTPGVSVHQPEVLKPAADATAAELVKATAVTETAAAAAHTQAVTAQASKAEDVLKVVEEVIKVLGPPLLEVLDLMWHSNVSVAKPEVASKLAALRSALNLK